MVLLGSQMGWEKNNNNKTCFPGGLDSKESVCNAEDAGSIPGSGRSPGEENGKPLQYYYLGNPMDKGAWQATVHRVCFY